MNDVAIVDSIKNDGWVVSAKVIGDNSARVSFNKNSLLSGTNASVVNGFFSNVRLGDIVEFCDYLPICKPLRNLTISNNFVESTVITSNPITEYPVFESNGDSSILKYHIVMLKNDDWGEFVMTPCNTYSKKSVFADSGRRNVFGAPLADAASHSDAHLVDLIRFCNLKPGDKVDVSRRSLERFNTDKPRILDNLGYVIEFAEKVAGR